MLDEPSPCCNFTLCMRMESNSREKSRQSNHSLSIKPWQQQAELQGPESSPGQAPNPDSDILGVPISEPEVSSIVNDLGDAKQLAQTRDRGHPRSGHKTGVLVSYGVKGFQDATSQPGSNKPDILSGTEIPKRKAKNVTVGPNISQKLGRKIRVALKTSSWEKESKSFLPIDELDRIIDRESIHKELQQQAMDVCLVDQIWDERGSASSLTTRRKIFAILVLIGQVPAIIDFIEKDLYDSDLPLLFIKGAGHREGSYDVFRKVTEPDEEPEKRTEIRFFQKWEDIDLENFNEKQWQFLAPYFELESEMNPRVSHYNLGSHVVLPFIEDYIADEPLAQHGGSADVRRVKIHHAHQDSWTLGDKDEHPSYAVKRLISNDKTAFEHEVAVLKRFSGKNKHQHLISLLLTYHYREHYHLLFHWADGNLLDFCKRSYPSPDNPRRNSKFAKWVCGQFLGVVEGLQAIETYTSDSPHSRKYGRHGDIKPENILWFKETPSDGGSPENFGSFVISDFGLAMFHCKESKSHVNPETLGRSHTYSPPEYDVLKEVSQKSDIWSLGCVLLEFLHWYLLGWRGVEEFQTSRMADGNSPEMLLDDYFNFYEFDSSQKRTKLKKSVHDAFDRLRHHQGTDPFFLRVLGFVQKKLLRMEPTKRAGCGEILKFFKTLNESSSWDDQDPEPFPPPRRTSTDLSELVGPFASSPRDEIRRSLDLPPQISRNKIRFRNIVNYVIAQQNGLYSSSDTREGITLNEAPIPTPAEAPKRESDTNPTQDMPSHSPRKVHFDAKQSPDTHRRAMDPTPAQIRRGTPSNHNAAPDYTNTLDPPTKRRRITLPNPVPVD